MVTQNWICDQCNEPIKLPEQGWLEWTRKQETEELADFQIVHYPWCLRNEKIFRERGYAVPGFPLQHYLGRDGLIRMLKLLANTDKKNQDLLIETIQRLHIPGYEEARMFFEEAYLKNSIAAPHKGVYYPEIEQINEIIKKYK